jgi:predicted TIM-barrel fold metal-dependent hydrolase
MEKYKVIDSDGHVREVADEIRALMPARWRRNSLFGSDTWDRFLGGRLGVQPKGVHDQLAALDEDQIDYMVMYPSGALSIGMLKEQEFATHLTRAYNEWMSRFCQADPKRLHYVALIAPQDVTSAAEELRRAVTELGAVGVMMPTHIPQRPEIGHAFYDPIYAEAERLDVGISSHPTTNGSLGSQRFNNFINVHSIDFPVEQMIALCSTVVGGVFERFPKLRVAYLESGAGWVPYMMQRLDEEVEKRGELEAPYLTKMPSEYILGGRIFFGAECEEKTLPDAVRWGLEDTILYASDYPHWDCDWPHTVQRMAGRDDLSDEVKRKFFYSNATRFYGPTLLKRMGVAAAPTGAGRS